MLLLLLLPSVLLFGSCGLRSFCAAGARAIHEWSQKEAVAAVSAAAFDSSSNEAAIAFSAAALACSATATKMPHGAGLVRLCVISFLAMVLHSLLLLLLVVLLLRRRLLHFLPAFPLELLLFCFNL